MAAGRLGVGLNSGGAIGKLHPDVLLPDRLSRGAVGEQLEDAQVAAAESLDVASTSPAAFATHDGLAAAAADAAASSGMIEVGATVLVMLTGGSSCACVAASATACKCCGSSGQGKAASAMIGSAPDSGAELAAGGDCVSG